MPESLCNLPDECEISVYGNNLCEEYHFDCIDRWDGWNNMGSSPQDQSNCDCNGITGGGAVVDECGLCSGGNTIFEFNEFLGCDDICYSGLELDECGVCDGDNSTCTGCLYPNASNYDESAIIGDDSCCIELWGECYNMGTTDLDLSDNNLTGEIPPEISYLGILSSLKLDGNNLTGSIPSELGNIRNLIHLDLSDNNLSGDLSDTVINFDNGWLPHVEYLDLSGNDLLGDIPSSVGIQLGALTHLDLSNNNLQGEIPEELCDLIESNNLDIDNILSGNSLTNTCE